MDYGKLCSRVYDTADIRSVARQTGIVSNNHPKWRLKDRYQRVAMRRPLNIVKRYTSKKSSDERNCISAVRDTCHWSPFAKICLHEFSIQGAFEKEKRGAIGHRPPPQPMFTFQVHGQAHDIQTTQLYIDNFTTAKMITILKHPKGPSCAAQRP